MRATVPTATAPPAREGMVVAQGTAPPETSPMQGRGLSGQRGGPVGAEPPAGRQHREARHRHAAQVQGEPEVAGPQVVQGDERAHRA